jgi:F420-dependent oxidoreductase-like protein
VAATALRLGLFAGFEDGRIDRFVDTVRLADSLGYTALWTGEAYGSDGVVPLAYAAAVTERIKLGTSILQMPARTPAMTAMTAATLDAMSGGRFLLGLGTSGPQVVEGWHGRPFTKPLATTREYVEIVRRILAREHPLSYSGDVFEIPYRGEDGVGLGKPLKIMLHPRSDIPIYIAAIGPRNVALAAEIADGFLPIFWSPTRWKAAFGDALAGVDFGHFDVAATVRVAVGDDLDRCRDAVRPFLALYIGGMGSRGKNFYNDLACRYGYEKAAAEIQDLYLDGKQGEAAAAVPDELVDDVALVGPRERIADQLEAWRESPATTLNVAAARPEVLRMLAELVF